MRRAHHAAAVALACCTCACGLPRPRPLPPVMPSRVWNLPQRDLCASAIANPAAAGTIASVDLTEASGLVASPSHPGVLWSHNDSGDTARIFALGVHGEDLGQAALTGVTAVDFEEIKAAPCPDLAGPCLYLADTGDNLLSRAEMIVYALPEPDVAPDRPLPAGAALAPAWRFPMSVVDGPIDIEAFIVLPDVSAMIFYEKVDTAARILKYAAPWTPDVTATLDVTGTFEPPGVAFGGGKLPTSADVHTTGTRLVLRTYSGAFEAHLDADHTADHLDAADLVELFLGPGSEPQGEAVAYDEAGTGIFTVSESPDGTPHQPLNHAGCE